MILEKAVFNGWTVLQEKTANNFNDYRSWSGYKDIPTFSGSQRITSPCFHRLADFKSWVKDYDQHHVR